MDPILQSNDFIQLDNVVHEVTAPAIIDDAPQATNDIELPNFPAEDAVQHQEFIDSASASSPGLHQAIGELDKISKLDWADASDREEPWHTVRHKKQGKKHGDLPNLTSNRPVIRAIFRNSQ